jgi:hypothetical protein
VQIAMGLASIFLCLVSVFVLFLLSYKFSSHNRYVGYSKLLAHEELDGATNPSSLFLWEICMDRLRARNYRKTLLSRYCEEIQQWTPGADDLKRRIDKQIKDSEPSLRYIRGLGLLFLGRGEEKGSWKFPVSVARVFAAVNFILVLCAFYFCHGAPGYHKLRWVAGGLFALLILAWLIFLSKLYAQVAGIERVESFCWLFVPIRSKLLREIYPNLQYRLKMVSEEENDGTMSAAAGGKTH